MKVVLKPGDVYSIDFNVTLNIHRDIAFDKESFISNVQKHLDCYIRVLLGHEGVDA